MGQTYTITDLAKEFQVTTRTIRHYEDEGLVQPLREGSARVYNNRDRGRLRLALRGKRLGISLGDIRELFALYDLAHNESKQVEEFLAKLDKHRAQLEQQQTDIEVMLREFDFFSQQCRRLNQNKSRTDTG